MPDEEHFDIDPEGIVEDDTEEIDLPDEPVEDAVSTVERDPYENPKNDPVPNR